MEIDQYSIDERAVLETFIAANKDNYDDKSCCISMNLNASKCSNYKTFKERQKKKRAKKLECRRLWELIYLGKQMGTGLHG